MVKKKPKRKMKEKVYYNEKTSARADIDQAIERGLEKNKHILLIFGANWCPWCRTLNRLLTRDAKIKDFVETYYEVVLIDMGFLNKNLDLNEKYGNPIELGLPAFVVLDNRGNQLVIQETVVMESKSKKRRKYQPDKVYDFLKRWIPPSES